MRLRNLDNQLLLLYSLRDSSKYDARQRSAIIDCINALKEAPEEVGYQDTGRAAEYLVKRYNGGC
jgi:hypothetical protein